MQSPFSTSPWDLFWDSEAWDCRQRKKLYWYLLLVHSLVLKKGEFCKGTPYNSLANEKLVNPAGYKNSPYSSEPLSMSPTITLRTPRITRYIPNTCMRRTAEESGG